MALYANEPFADSLIKEICKKEPALIYNYAQDTGSVAGKLILRNADPMVKAVVNLTKLPMGLLYFPFLDDLISGERQTKYLEKIITDEESGTDTISYYKLLVQTEIKYHRRLIKGDTAVGFFGRNGLKEMLKKKALQHFIIPINEMHEKAENVRMKPVGFLSAVDIYYMLVMGEEDIYTSSYEKSFTRMLQRMGKKPATDSLLREIDNDYFKKFVRMAANFNRLDAFLNLMPVETARSLMKDFVGGLEIPDDLEDATDVADSYGSINNKTLQADILNYVSGNEQRCAAINNSRGRVIYKVLKTIFLSADHPDKTDNTEAIGITPIYSIENKALQDDSGRIIEQVFFYGDGGKIFSDYINSFSPKDWKVNNTVKEWVEIQSLKKPQILIYANRPLNANNNLDDSAQVHLNKFLSSHHLLPSIIIHRGHSYWLPGTMDRMPGYAKIVVLGSCGGYKDLNQLIEINPDAHIISTKQIGTGLINYNIMQALNRVLLSGETIDWRKMWNSLNLLFAKQPAYIREAWNDYVPPYKNLGSVFLKAFNKSIEY